LEVSEAFYWSPGIGVRAAVREAVEILDEGQMANTTIGSLGDDSAGTNASHKEIILTDAIVLVRALTPVRPFRQDAIDRIVINTAMEGPVGSVGRSVDVSELISSVVKKSNLTTRKPLGTSDCCGITEYVESINLWIGECQGGSHKGVRTVGKANEMERAERGALGSVPKELAQSGKSSARRTIILKQLQNLDIVVDMFDVFRWLRVGESSEEILVLVEAILIGVGDVGNKVSISVLRVTIIVEAATAVLLGRFATVGPVIVEITAELRLAGTVSTIGGIETGIEVVDTGVAIPVSSTLIDSRVDRDASRSRSGGMATVSVVRAKGTLEDSAVNALVLTAGDVGLVDAAGALTLQEGLATVNGVLVAIGIVSLAGEQATTSSERGGVTVAKNGAVGENIGKVNVLRAVNGAETRDRRVGLSLLATGRPVIVGVLAQSVVAVEDALLRGGVASSSARLSTREGQAVEADATTATSVVVEDAISSSVDGALALVNLTTVLGGVVAIKEVGVASVGALTRI